MSFQKCLSICIFILAIVVLTQQLASAKQPAYLEGEKDLSRSEESMLREEMERVREEIEMLKNFKHLHELQKELRHLHIENRKHELEQSIIGALIEIENLKRRDTSREIIERVVSQVEEWQRGLEGLHRLELELDERIVPPKRRAKVIVLHLEHAPAEHIGEIIEDFLTDEGIVRADERTNSLIVRDIEPSLHDIEMIVDKLDQPEEPHPIGTEFMPPKQGREIANVLDITEESIIVDFPEHSEWPEVEFWIPFREQDDGEWDRDVEITEQVRHLEIGSQIEVEWERDEERFWLLGFELRDLEIPIEEIQELMEHALQASSPEEALERFEDVQEHDPKCTTVYGKGAQIMIGVNLMELGKLEEAENAIKIGLDLFPENDRSVWTLAGYEALGRIYHESDDLDQAIEMYQRAMELYNPDDRNEPIIAHHKTVRMKLAQIYVQTDQNESAIETLESAIELDWDIPRLDARVHLMLGELQMKNGNLKSAKAEFQKVLDLAEEPEAEIDDDVIEKAEENLKKIEKGE